MDAEVKAKWLTALRSGEYEQGKHHLERSGKYCCLGVLADLVGILPDLDRLEKAIVPVPRLGLRGEQQSALARLNDTEGKSFTEIADYIEANL